MSWTRQHWSPPRRVARWPPAQRAGKGTMTDAGRPSLVDIVGGDDTARRGSGEAVVAARGLSAGYGGIPVVRNLDLEVHSGEIVALLGPNGAGKSTTVLTLAGELVPLEGEVLTRGKKEVAPLHRRARAGVGFVGEERTV